jgi:TRAP transporter TAXI family solute receptor
VGLRWALAAAVLTALAVGCGGSGNQGSEPGERAPERLTITTGGKGGIYYVYGGALANVITRHLPGYRATAQPSTGAVENLLRLRDGKADIALTLGDTALDAVEGREAFKRPVPLRAIAQIYRSYVHVVVAKGSGIRSLADLKGKRVSVGSPDSGTEVVAERVLKLARIDSRNGIARRQLGVAESAAALADGSLDAFFWSGGLPTGAVVDLARAHAISMLDLGALAKPLRQRYGGVYEDASIPAATYQGVSAPVPTVAIPNYIVVSAKMNGGLAFDLTNLLFKRAGDLVAAHPESRSLDPARAQQVIAPIRLHAGAQQYYDRAGG